MDNSNSTYVSALSRAVNSASGDPNSIVSTVALAPLRAEFEAETAYQGSRRKVVVKAALDSDDRVFLQNNVYKHVHVDFQASSYSSHSMANARRFIEQEIFIWRVHKKQRVVDIGGNWHDHLVKGRYNIHSAAPLLDVRDSARHTRRVLDANKWARTVIAAADAAVESATSEQRAKASAARDFLSNPSHYFCNKLGEDCSVQCDVVFFFDSIYDIDFYTLPSIMSAHGAGVGYGFFIFSPEMLVDKEGFVRGMNCRWERRMVSETVEIGGVYITTRNREVITFTFKDDSCLEYTHDYVNYMLWCTRITVRDGDNAYLIERTYCEGIVRFEVLAIGSEIEYPQSNLSFSYWLPGVEDKVGVRVFWLNSLADSRSSLAVDSRVAWVDKRLVQKVLAYGCRLSDDKFTPKAMFDYCSSANVRATINGVDVSVKESLDTIEAWRVSFTLWFVVFMERYEQGFINSYFLAREQERRSIRHGSIMTLLLREVGSSFGKLFADHDGFVARLRQGLLTDLDKKFKDNERLEFPSVQPIEPLIRFEEVTRDFEGSYAAALEDPDEVSSWAKQLRRLVEPRLVAEALDRVTAQLRVMPSGDEERPILESAAALLQRRLMRVSPSYAGNAEGAWSDLELAERTLDRKVPLPGSADDALLERVEVGDDAGEESLRPSESASAVGFSDVVVLSLCRPEVTKEFHATFRGEVWLERGGSSAGLCAVGAMTTAAGVIGVEIDSVSVFEALKTSSRGGKVNWFSCSDVCQAAVSLGFNLAVLFIGASDCFLTGVSFGQVYFSDRPVAFLVLRDNHFFAAVPGTCSGDGEWFRYASITEAVGGSDSGFVKPDLASFGISTDALSDVTEGDIGFSDALSVVPEEEESDSFADASPPSDYTVSLRGDPASPVLMSRKRVRDDDKDDLSDLSDFSISPPVGYGTVMSGALGFSSSGFEVPTPTSDDEILDFLVRDKATPASVTNRGSSARVGSQEISCGGVVAVGQQSLSNGRLHCCCCRRARTSSKVDLPSSCQGEDPSSYSLNTIGAFSKEPGALGCVYKFVKVIFVALSRARSLSSAEKRGIWNKVRVLFKGVFGFALFSSPAILLQTLGLSKIVCLAGSFLKLCVSVVSVSAPFLGLGCAIVLPGILGAMWFVRSELSLDNKLPWSEVSGCRDVLEQPPVARVCQERKSTKTKPCVVSDKRYNKGWLTPLARADQIKSSSDASVEVDSLARNLSKSIARAPIFPGGTTSAGKKHEKDGISTAVEGASQTAVASKGVVPKKFKVDKKEVVRCRQAAFDNYRQYVEASVHHMERFCASVVKLLDAYGSTARRIDGFKMSPENSQWLYRQSDGSYSLPKGVKNSDLVELTCLFFGGKQDSLLGAAEYDAKEEKIFAWFPQKKQPSRLLFCRAMLKFLDFKGLQMLLEYGDLTVDPEREFTFVKGVPGCGKSSEICNSFSAGDLVAVQSVGGCEDLQGKFKRAKKDSTCVRTIGSRLLGRKQRCGRLFVDEAVKCHPGELVLLAEVTGAREVLLFGDDQQLEFSCRVPDFVVPEFDLHSTVEVRKTSYTAPIDVAVAIGRLKPDERGPVLDGKGYYPDGFLVTSKVEKSIKLKTISGNAGDVPRDSGAKYLAWTQDTKRQLLRAGFPDVHTVDEFQGGRARHVILVRLERNMDIRHRTSTGQMIVAISRHTDRLDYVTVEQTPQTSDLLYDTIGRLNAIDDIKKAYGSWGGEAQQ